MKTLAIILLALVGTLILNGPIQSYADPQLDALLQIATQARENLKMNISQITNVPDEITNLFNQGSNETDALSNSINQNDVTSARQHFLSAMNFFKVTNEKINSLNITQTNDQAQTSTLQLQSEISRIEKIGEMLKTISITNHASLDFSQFDQLIQKAKQDLDNGNTSEASKSIDEANSIVIDAHHSLTEVAKQRTSERAKDFTEKQIDRLGKIENTSENSTTQAPKIPPTRTISNFTIYENPKDVVTKLKKLSAEGKVDEALKMIKSFEAYQKVKLQPSGNP
jgi:cellobiose-specific phosphotransferase system component IIA